MHDPASKWTLQRLRRTYFSRTAYHDECKEANPQSTDILSSPWCEPVPSDTASIGAFEYDIGEVYVATLEDGSAHNAIKAV